MQNRRLRTILGGLLAVLLLAGCVHSPPSDPWDPIEPVNRVNYKINDTADTYVVRPAAKGYDTVVPDRVQAGISNFFDNVKQPVTMVNSLLQLKWGRFNQSLGRFMINSSVGLGGLFDVATRLDVPHPDEDFGQTLGYWGLGQGMYLYLPVIGPITGRDLIGKAGDQFTNPINYLNEIDTIDDHYQWTLYVLHVIELTNKRAGLLGLDKTLDEQFDPYAFVRSYYLEDRLKKVYDGDVPDHVKDYDDTDATDDSAPDDRDHADETVEDIPETAEQAEQ